MSASEDFRIHDSSSTVVEAVFSLPQKPQNASVLKGNCEEYRSIVSQYDWDTDVMLAIMKAESGCNPNALNDNPNTGDYSVGLFQINLFGGNAKSRPSEATLKIPSENIAFAYKIYISQGYKAWGVCRYKVNCY